MIKENNIIYYTVQEVAEILQVSANWVYQMLWRGTFTRYKRNKRTLILKDEIDNHLKVIKVD